MIKTISVLSLLALCNCATASLAESACDEQSLSFEIPNISSLPPIVVNNTPSEFSVTIPPVTKSTSFDFSSTINKINDVATNLNVDIDSLSLNNSNGEFSWVKYVAVTMQSTKLPSVPLAIYNAPAASSNQIDLMPALQASPTEILDYFKSGEVTLTITLGSEAGTVVDNTTYKMLDSLNGQIPVTVNVCVGVSAQVSKSL